MEAEEVSSDLCDKLLISSPGVETKRDGGVRLDQLTIWISKTSHMLRQVSFIQPTDTNMTASLERKVVFSDYRAVNGIAVPFLSEEYLAGRPLFKFKTETVEFNMGVDLSEFAIPEQTEASK